MSPALAGEFFTTKERRILYHLGSPVPNPHFSIQESPINKGNRWAIIHRVTEELDTTDHIPTSVTVLCGHVH